MALLACDSSAIMKAVGDAHVLATVLDAECSLMRLLV